MAFLKSQIELINSLVTDATITSAQGLDLLSSPDGFTAAQITFLQGLGLSATEEALLLAENRSTQEEIETEIAQAKRCILDGDYAGARKYVLLAEMTMASMSDYQIGNRRIEYREGIRYIKNSISDYESRSSATANKNRRVFASFGRG